MNAWWWWFCVVLIIICRCHAEKVHEYLWRAMENYSGDYHWIDQFYNENKWLMGSALYMHFHRWPSTFLYSCAREFCYCFSIPRWRCSYLSAVFMCGLPASWRTGVWWLSEKKKITRELLVKKKMKITFIAVVEMNNYISCGQYCNTPNTIMQLANANSHATQPHNALFHSYMVLLYLIYYMLSHAHIIHYH